MKRKSNTSIKKVLDHRKSSVQKASETVIFIDKLITLLEQLNSKVLEIEEFGSIDKVSRSIIEEIKLASPLLLRTLEGESKIWSNLISRFKRETINIGVIGKKRQGKSTFLQNVTNLTDKEIPAKEGRPCTSVQSVLYNAENNHRAEVHYYTENEFIEQVIKPYYEKLSVISEFSFSSMPKNLQEISQLELIHPSKITSFDAVAKGWYNNFYDIIDNCFDYLEDVKNGELKEASISKIKEVVQYHYNQDNNLTSFNFVGIKKVIIYCKFKNENAEKIGLIDLPGLGDTRLGDEERLIRALSEDVDFILFLKYPPNKDSSWGNDDNALYRTANLILKDRLPLNKWSFLLINNDANNISMCTDLLDQIPDIKEVEFAESLIVNVKDSNSAENALQVTLGYLSENIAALDKMLMNSCMTNLTNLNKEILRLSDVVSQLSYSTNIESKFYSRFEDFFSEFRNVIVDYRDTFAKERNESEEDFNNQIIAIIQSAKDAVKFPSKKEFKIVSKKELTEFKLYHMLVHHVRSHVLRNFHVFTNKQQEYIDIRKNEISNILSSPSLLEGLKNHSKKEGIEFLAYLKDKISRYPQFKNSGIFEGFDFICRFKISYEGSVQEIIYSTLVTYFSDKIQKIDKPTNLKEFYAKAYDITRIDLIKNDIEKSSDIDENESKKEFAFIEKNAKELMQICISVIGLFPGAEIITNVYDITKSILNILNSEKAVQIKKSETQANISELKQLISDSNETSNSRNDHQLESLESLRKTLFYMLDICQEELISTLGSSTHKISMSMTKEFFDHIGYTRESEYEWREFLRIVREQVWSDFEKDNMFNLKVVEIRQLTDSIEKLVKSKLN